MISPAAVLLALVVAPAPAQPAAEEPPVALSTAVAGAAAPRRNPALTRARRLYFTADVLRAAEAFRAAVKAAPRDPRAWSDGALAWGEAGRPDEAAAWSRRAAELDPSAESETALGWALLRDGRPSEAEGAFASALRRDPSSRSAELGRGRAELAMGRPAQAEGPLKRAAADLLQRSLASYYLGRAEEALGRHAAALEAFRRAVASDSYFHEGREPLTRAYLRARRYRDAWRQLKRLVKAEPGARLTRALARKAAPFIAGFVERKPASERGPVRAPRARTQGAKGIPLLRVGIGTTARGRPMKRESVTVRGSGAWRAYDPRTGRTLATCAAQESWSVVRVPPVRRRVRGRARREPARLELRGPDGQRVRAPGLSVRLAPLDAAGGVLQLEDDPRRGDSLNGGRPLRGVIEVSLFSGRRWLRLVNVVDLEDYVEGVVGAEMPTSAPLEALKVQALIARTHALYLKSSRRRHRRDGYDLCDGDHCQVYSGVRVETARTRAAVAATRGEVLRYHGRLVQTLYSANCGGWTQSGTDVGWGQVPYWRRMDDSPRPGPPPDSPGSLRRYLTTWPDAYCRPSSLVYPSHSRWARVVPAAELGAKLDRRFRIGRLEGLRVLRRAPTGNVEALLVVGSRRRVKLTHEISIRSLLGVGSLRSTLFVVDPEYRRETVRARGRTRTRLVLDDFVFQGGGWGHAVGLCQSGAIGRAVAGQDAEEIVKAYFAGAELSPLPY